MFQIPNRCFKWLNVPIVTPRNPNVSYLKSSVFLDEAQDMLHLCEKLALRGFVCASVDFAEGLSGAVPRQIARQEIVQEPLDQGFLLNKYAYPIWYP